MSKMFAVSHINWDANDLTTIFVEAVDWRFAAMMHPKISDGFQLGEDEEIDKPTLPEDQDKAKEESFDQDMMINIVEVPEDCNDGGS